MAASSLVPLTAEQYLELDRSADYKSEFLNGKIIAMSGGLPNHSRIARNLMRQIDPLTEQRGCEAFTSDLRVKATAQAHFYPDLTVSCGKPEFDPNVGDLLLNPTLIFEILSKSTESYDRGAKFQEYRKIESLHEYVLVSQTKPLVEVYDRALGPDQWTLHIYEGLEVTAYFIAIDFAMRLSDIYNRVEFKP